MGEPDRLLERAREHDIEALGQIYDAYHTRIYRYISARVGNGSLAEDLTGEVFTRMLESLRIGTGVQNSLSGWLYRVAQNLVVDHYRSNMVDDEALAENRLPSHEERPEHSVEQALQTEELRRAMSHLTEDQQNVVLLKFVEGLSNVEVADVLGKTEGAVKSLQHRALGSLARHMAIPGEA